MSDPYTKHRKDTWYRIYWTTKFGKKDTRRLKVKKGETIEKAASRLGAIPMWSTVGWEKLTKAK